MKLFKSIFLLMIITAMAFAACNGGNGGEEDGDEIDTGRDDIPGDVDAAEDTGADDSVTDVDAMDADVEEIEPPRALEELCPNIADLNAAQLPALPSVYVETDYTPPTGRSLAVDAGGDLQAAIDEAQSGDVITLEAGATFTGPFRLKNKDGDGWIIIRTSAGDDEIPPPGTRINPSYSGAMARLATSVESVIRNEADAHHYRFIGIQMGPAEGVFLYSIVQLESGAHHIIFDRCYLHGDPQMGTRRGIAMNSSYTAVIDSYLKDFKEEGADSQALCGWEGPGPFAIINNYLEGAAENIMFGGADPDIEGLVPSDIEIRHNHFRKPLSWRIDDPSYEGTPWSIKNLFELKNARRVLVDGNIFEYNWAHAQSGFAILLTVRNQDGTAPWSAVQDVVFSRNIVRHTGSGMTILARDNQPSERTVRILVCNNLFEDVDGGTWGGDGRLFQVLKDTQDVIFDHNTGFHSGNVITSEGDPSTGFIYRNNVTPHNLYGVVGTGTGTGMDTLDTYFPDAVFVRNVLAGGDGSDYPRDNFFPATLDDVGFADLAGGDYRLSLSSPFAGQATDGTDVGAYIDALLEATAGVVR